MGSWPPQYQVRTSTRAKRVQLQISAMRGIELVMPSRIRGLNVERFIDFHRDWIEQKLKELTKVKYQGAKESYLSPPRALVLPALGKSWDIQYNSIIRGISGAYFTEKNKIILYAGRSQEQKIAYIKLWLAHQAKKSLGLWLNRLSDKTNLSFKSYSIRGQKHCWGSCSSEKKISLNYKLLFLPKKIVNYVLLHELCHLKYCDHSKQFWSLVSQWEPNYQELDKLSRQGDCYVPPWLS